LKFRTAGKPWTLPLANGYDRSVAGYESIAFEIKTDGGGGASKELYVQLQDSSPDTLPVLTVRVPVVEEKFVQGGVIDGSFRRVVVPLSRLLREPEGDSPRFRPTMLNAVMLSGDGDTQNYWLGPVQLLAPDGEGRQP